MKQAIPGSLHNGGEVSNRASPVAQANFEGRRIGGVVHPGAAAKNSEADAPSGRVPTATGTKGAPELTSPEPVAAWFPVTDKMRQPPAPQFARRTGEVDVPAANNDHYHGGEDDRKYRTK